MNPAMVAALRGLAYRPMVEADLDGVAELEPTLHACPWTRGNFADALLAGYSCWVCSDEQRMLGYAVMMLAVDESHLLNISVRREHQRCGLGRRFLAYLQGVAKGFGAVCMFLEVRPSNAAARALYEADGFRLVGTRRGYYPAPGGREDALLMKREL